jgi:hypothetical protein
MYLFSVGNNNSPSDASFYSWCETMISGKELPIKEVLHHLQFFSKLYKELLRVTMVRLFPLQYTIALRGGDQTNRRRAMISLK